MHKGHPQGKFSWNDGSPQLGYQRHKTIVLGAIETLFEGWRARGQAIHGSDGGAWPAQWASQLMTRLGALRGPLMKAAQLTAMLPDVLPKPWQEALATLCAHAPPMGPAMTRRVLDHALGPQWSDLFQDFDLVPRFAASLGQVHRARLWGYQPHHAKQPQESMKANPVDVASQETSQEPCQVEMQDCQSGQLVACKVQYPGLQRAIETDLGYLRRALSWYQGRNPGLDLAVLLDELRQRLIVELDYHSERNNILLFAKIFANDPLLVIPKVYPQACSQSVLTMQWLDGQFLPECAVEHRPAHLAQSLIGAWYRPLFSAGVMHGDPHTGNMTLDPDGRLNLLDFGCVRQFSWGFVRGFIRLYQGFLLDSQSLRQQGYADMGLVDICQKQRAILDGWVRFVLAPFLVSGRCRLRDHFDPTQAMGQLAWVQNQLAQVGPPVRLPSDFLIFDRVAVVLGSVLIQMDVQAHWDELLQTQMAYFPVGGAFYPMGHPLGPDGAGQASGGG
jgi:predicted unusual protein kinase regulating ubiquinone biosynthesis (AarF/ABC1/UbiB family)